MSSAASTCTPRPPTTATSRRCPGCGRTERTSTYHSPTPSPLGSPPTGPGSVQTAVVAESQRPVLTQVAEGVLVHQSDFLQSNAVVVQGRAGVLLIDAGVTGDELAALASELGEMGQSVVAGFSTHPHWDHLLWHAGLGAPPRYGTARCAATVRERLPDASAKARVTQMMPPELAGQVPLELLGDIAGLPAETTEV